MNITKKERDELNALSLKIYGVSSKWKKILEKQKIYNGHVVDRVATKKAQASALDMLKIGIDNEEVQSALTADVKKATFRSLTVPEVKEALQQMSDAKDYAEMTPAATLKKAAGQFLEKTLRFEIALEVSKEEASMFEDALRQLPDEQAGQLRKVVVEAAKPSILTFNGLAFVNTLLEMKIVGEESA